jgi:prephenate dehydrogenase
MDLFDGRPWLFTPEEDAKAAPLQRLFAFARSLGAAPHALSAAEHDRVMAFVSHLPQLTASALMRVTGDGAGDAGLSLSGPGLADTTRLAASPFGIWADICATNADAIGAALDRLIAELSDIRACLAEPDRLAGLFWSASTWRERLRALSSARTTEASPSSPGAPIPDP